MNTFYHRPDPEMMIGTEFARKQEVYIVNSENTEIKC